ncbi:hypothetical protein GCM10011509_09900 [Ornithinimicrobium pekingense]|uniref:Ig-like domain-containing protein n=1 Tax=Ornithinimicrobium pekingense TaxID=384677 RepID=A0ABQ2F5P4_9MICO|nr:hypothetical protein GCM10011509_09900 [Ornithinimicrobium pekingense]
MSAHVRTVELGVGESGLTEGCRGCGGGTAGCGTHGRDCDCGGHRCATCGGASERPRWFAGQLVGPSDLEALQQWVIGRNRRHNRMLHGWGVACGLTVTQTLDQQGAAQPWSVTVGEGYALSGCGDEVCVPGPVRIDIRQPRPDGVDGCAPPVDPWCAPVRQRRDPERTYYLAVRYAEEQRRPVRTACDCGCDDNPCEYSRVGETYTLAVLDSLPDCYQEDLREQPHQDVSYAAPRNTSSTTNKTSAVETLQEAVGCSERIRRLGTRPCPDCCSPWVVLADLKVDTRGTVTLDPLSHRRFLASFGSYGFSCTPRSDHLPTVTITQPESGGTFPSAHETGLELKAKASDPEDGELSGGSVQWFDSHHDAQHEPLGAGTSLTTTLSWDDQDKPYEHTQHTVLVEATDSDGHVAADSVTIKVGQPAPPPPPPRITAFTPASGAMLPLEWNSKRRIEVTFDEQMNQAQLAIPDPWFRVWEIHPEHDVLGIKFTTIKKLSLTLTGSPSGTKTLYALEESPFQGFLYLVQIRLGSALLGDKGPPRALDCDFAGTKLSGGVLDEIWSMPAGTEHRKDKGWFDWNAWSSTSAALPSGDGTEGGTFHLLFNVQAPIN